MAGVNSRTGPIEIAGPFTPHWETTILVTSSGPRQNRERGHRGCYGSYAGIARAGKRPTNDEMSSQQLATGQPTVFPGPLSYSDDHYEVCFADSMKRVLYFRDNPGFPLNLFAFLKAAAHFSRFAELLPPPPCVTVLL